MGRLPHHYAKGIGSLHGRYTNEVGISRLGRGRTALFMDRLTERTPVQHRHTVERIS